MARLRIDQRFLLRSPLLVLTLSLSACAFTPKFTWKIEPRFTPVVSDVSRMINAMLNEDMTAGLAIALVDRTGPVWVTGFGEADAASGQKVDAHTVFRVGSLSKPFTALAVLQQAESGRVSLDRPLVEFLPEFSIRSHDHQGLEITPRLLLSHRSGLPSDLRKGMYTDAPFTRAVSSLADEYLAYSPGSVYSYSNLGFDVLGMLVQAHSHSDFAQAVHDALFAPLGMRSSGFSLDASMRERLAAGHLDGNVRPQPPLRDTPALGLYTTVTDMATFLTRLLRADIPGVSAALIDKAWRPQNGHNDIALGTFPGLGWFVEHDALLGKVVRHGGSTLLFAAEAAILPDDGLAVIVMSNSANSSTLVRKVSAATLLLARQVIHAQDSPLMVSETARIGGITESPSAGGYATDLGLLMIDSDKPRLCACIIEQVLDMVRFDDGSFALTPESAAQLSGPYRILGEMRFSTRRAGNRELLLASTGENRDLQVLGNRIDNLGWQETWKDRIGAYRTVNPDGAFSVLDLQLSDENGVICLHYRVPHLSDNEIRVPLMPVSETQAIIEGIGRGRGETVTIEEKGGKVFLRFSGFVGELTHESR